MGGHFGKLGCGRLEERSMSKWNNVAVAVAGAILAAAVAPANAYSPIVPPSPVSSIHVSTPHVNVPHPGLPNPCTYCGGGAGLLKLNRPNGQPIANVKSFEKVYTQTRKEWPKPVKEPTPPPQPGTGPDPNSNTQ
jgi:hypothetical protein